MADTSIVELLQMLAKVWVDDIEVEGRAKSGNNQIHEAVLTGNPEACRQEAQRCKVNEGNLRGDTPLHLAVRWITHVGVNLIEVLLEAGADVNARNKWGQTPLHYAVTVKSVDNVKRLLGEPNIDINASDINGYTPLHCCFSVDFGRTPGPYLESISYDLDLNANFIKIAEALIRAGASLNTQTKFGLGILHFVAARNDNTPLIKHLMEKYQAIELTQKTLLRENFLHVYCRSELFEDITETLEFIAKLYSPTIVKELLSGGDVSGRPPWAYMIDTSNIDNETVRIMMSYGVSVSEPDNLGNTAIHRLAGVSASCVLTDVLESLITSESSLLSQNVYDETPAFVLFLDPVFEIFHKHKINFNARDRWGRTPLMSIMKHRPIPELLTRMILEGEADVNATDAYGSTPLHFAAYHNYHEQLEILLDLGANKDAKDMLQDRPLDTVKRHCSYRCYTILKRAEGFEELYGRVRSFDEVLLGLPKSTKSSSVKTYMDIQKTMMLPENRQNLWDFLLETYYDRSQENAKEVDRIVEEVNALVQEICTTVAGYDHRFKMSVFPTGSSAEGTKVGRPDEFDFVLCIDHLNEITKPVLIKECIEAGFACLKFTKDPVPEEFMSFCDSEGYFLAFPYLQLLKKYLERALNENTLWRSGNLYYNYEDKMVVIRGKPVFNFDVYWIGSVYKQLKISIDLVPAVYKKGWWPANINVDQIPLMTDEIKHSGCILILQSRSYEFDYEKGQSMDNNISFTCNSDQNKALRRMLRVSAAPAEISLMKSLPPVFRRAYALAKIMKGKEVCPEIEFESINQWTNLLQHQRKFDEKKPLPVNPSHVIKSYMLKNCTFYAMLEMKKRSSDIHPSVITAKIFQFLLHFADNCYLNPFFLPYSDVFEFEKDTKKSSFDEFISKIKRELSIKLILGMLGQHFPEHCLTSQILPL
ncbi:uncharacterized protein LOC116287147 [Actinia tenebrosa]|uniref:Uncharacterized protein LOC116287147 n=1 Tax=Actinia tenebrosa TaxID=6105 RepID=A0A6P8HAC9_ACTTE|nr:uncharacterized protein LOC116287147 [Actinia tenebrosa]